MINDNPSIATREASQLSNHAIRLEDLLNSVERAAQQYGNALARLRGNVPEVASPSDTDKVSQIDPPHLQRLNHTTDKLHVVCETLNGMANELNEYI